MLIKGVAYRKMFLSFLTVFAIPLCAIFLFYYVSFSITEKQAETSNTNFIQTIRSTCDREIQYYRNVLVQLSMDENIKDTIGRDIQSKGMQSVIFNLPSSLFEAQASISVLGNDCKDIFIYYPEAGKIFSWKAQGSLRYDVYIETYCTSDKTIAKEIKDYLTSYPTKKVHTTTLNMLGGDMALITYSRAHSNTQNEVILGLWLDMDALDKRVTSVDWEKGYAWMILNSAGSVIKGTSQTYAVGETVPLDHILNDPGYFCYTANSPLIDWTYIMMMPKNIVQNSANQLRIFFTISIILCLGIAVIIIRKVTLSNYTPLNNLVRAFASDNESDFNPNDEFRFIDQKIRNLLEDKSSMEDGIQKRDASLTRLNLASILVSPPESLSNGSPLQDYLLQLSDEQVLVLNIKIRSDCVQDTNEDLPIEMKKFVIENVFLEKIGSIIPCMITELEGKQVLVLHGEAIGHKCGQIESAINELQQFISEHFSFQSIVAAGGIHHGVSGVHSSYLEAREAEEFIYLLDENYINYDEIKDRTSRSYTYSLQAEERISTAVRNNNKQLASVLINKVIEDSWGQKQMSPRTLRYLIIDIYCTLLKSADEKGWIERIYALKPNISSSTPISELELEFSKVLESICDVNSEQNGGNSDRVFCDRVLEYIKSNFSNSNINISQTALHFHISPAALSTMYRNETGKSLLNVINEIRVEKAIEYLKQGYSVSETAEKVGIPESSTFIRMFKKQVGTTPGKIKEGF